MKKSYWRKADNSGMIYPLIMTLSQQSNFRLSAELTLEIDPKILREALIKTYQKYPMFKVELNIGLFRSCFVENFDTPVVFPSDGVVLGRINATKNKGYLIKVSYYKKLVIAEFFHGLTDGTGAREFFAYLLSEYVCIAEGLQENLLDEFFPSSNGRDEDAYEKYYKKGLSLKSAVSSVSKNAARVKGDYFYHEGLGVVSGACSVASVKELSAQTHSSITSVISGAALLAARHTLANDDKDPAVMIPVNLRRFFPSDTLLNFVCMNTIAVPDQVEDSFDGYVRFLDERLKKDLNAENLQKSISVTSTLAHTPVARFAPAFLKRFLIVLGRSFVVSTKQTLIVSNLGEFKLPTEVAPFVVDFEFLLNCNRRTPLNCAVASYDGNLRIAFSRHIASTQVEKKFFEILRENGVDCVIRSNYRELKK